MIQIEKKSTVGTTLIHLKKNYNKKLLRIIISKGIILLNIFYESSRFVVLNLQLNLVVVKTPV